MFYFIKSVLIVHDVSGGGVYFRLGVPPPLFNAAENPDFMKNNTASFVSSCCFEKSNSYLLIARLFVTFGEI